MEHKEMNKLEFVCDFLGIKINKPFQINGYDEWYIITDFGHGYWSHKFSNSMEDYHNSYTELLIDLLTGDCTVRWSPKIGDRYYYPSVKHQNGIDCCQWNDMRIDRLILKRVGIYETEEKALEKAKELGWVD